MAETLQAAIAAFEKGSRVPGTRIAALARRFDLSQKQVMLELLARDVWPERFCRNMGLLSAAKMSRLLGMRVFIAGCGGLGGAVAAMLARTGIGMMRICDPDVFEESNLNRQMFCNEKTLGKPKAAVVRSALLDIASHLEVEAVEVAATASNLPALLKGMDVAVDCLDSIAAKKMLEKAAEKAGIAFLHGSIAADEGLAWLDAPADGRLARLYPRDNSAAESLPVLAETVCGTAALMCALLTRGRAHQTPILHLDLSVPEMEAFQMPPVENA